MTEPAAYNLTQSRRQHQASGILENAGAHVPDEQVATQLHDALRSREAIAQAQGVLMERDRLSPDEASAQLRRTARETNITLRRLAEDTVASATGRGPRT